MKICYLLLAVAVLLFHVASGQPDHCRDLGGYCQMPLRKKCPYGSLPANCGTHAQCCKKEPPTTKDCAALGGYCHVPQSENCPSGKDLPANCGINGRCCQPIF